MGERDGGGGTHGPSEAKENLAFLKSREKKKIGERKRENERGKRQISALKMGIKGKGEKARLGTQLVAWGDRKERGLR